MSKSKKLLLKHIIFDILFVIVLILLYRRTSVLTYDLIKDVAVYYYGTATYIIVFVLRFVYSLLFYISYGKAKEDVEQLSDLKINDWSVKSIRNFNSGLSAVAVFICLSIVFGLVNAFGITTDSVKTAYDYFSPNKIINVSTENIKEIDTDTAVAFFNVGAAEYKWEFNEGDCLKVEYANNCNSDLLQKQVVKKSRYPRFYSVDNITHLETGTVDGITYLVGGYTREVDEKVPYTIDVYLVKDNSYLHCQLFTKTEQIVTPQELYNICLDFIKQ